MEKNFDNELLKRKEVVFEIESDSCPSFAQASKIVSEKYKVDESLVVIKKVDGSYGTHKFIVSAFLYKDAENKERIEQKPKVKKETGK